MTNLFHVVPSLGIRGAVHPPHTPLWLRKDILYILFACMFTIVLKLQKICGEMSKYFIETIK
jgi:hypothetical protein